jgi:uncharacterized small protein (DUF1192 family)
VKTQARLRESLAAVTGPQWIAGIALATALALSGWYAYYRGQKSAGLELASVTLERRELNDRITRLDEENARLNARVAELEMARQLDRDAYGQIETTLGDLQSQLARQGEDLAFYRSIVSPADGIQGLRIQRFEVQNGAGPDDYKLKLTLIQAMRHETVVSGLAQIVIHGTLEDRPARYSLGELLGRPNASLPFSFRYFQTLEQEIKLPPGFQAYESEVQLRSSKLRFPVRESFPWKVEAGAVL